MYSELIPRSALQFLNVENMGYQKKSMSQTVLHQLRFM